MKNIIIFSDNELLNQLYLINLEIYIGASVTIIKDINSAKKSFKEFKNYDLIISVAMLNEYEIGKLSYMALEELCLPVPFILIGSPHDEMPNATIVPSSYNLQTLLRAIASVLGVTAKTMSEISVPKYYPISISYLQHIQNTPCDLYLQIKGPTNQHEYVLCSTKDTQIIAIIKKLQKEGVTNLFVLSQDRLMMVNKISLSLALMASGTSGASTNAKSDAVSAGFSFVAAQLIENAEVVQEIVTIADACSKVMDNVMSEVSGIKALVKILMQNQEGYIYTHSMLTAYVAKHIIKHVAWGGDSHIERINFMVFFHDLYLVPIYEKYPKARKEEDLLFGEMLTDEEKELVLNHARLAGEQITKYKKCPSGIDTLIKQHHGMSNGVGFATEFSDNISPLSKLFMIAEEFAEYYLDAKYKDKNFKINLPEYVSELHLKYSKHTYKKIIEPLLTLKV